jgi:hypothetical protein
VLDRAEKRGAASALTISVGQNEICSLLVLASGMHGAARNLERAEAIRKLAELLKRQEGEVRDTLVEFGFLADRAQEQATPSQGQHWQNHGESGLAAWARSRAYAVSGSGTSARTAFASYASRERGWVVELILLLGVLRAISSTAASA